VGRGGGGRGGGGGGGGGGHHCERVGLWRSGIVDATFPSMCRGISRCAVGWAKELQDGCPPSTARAPANEVLYRNVRAIPPMAEDFRSLHEIGRSKPENVSECRWRGVSLWTTIEQCRNVAKIPAFRRQGLTTIASVSLTPDSGAIERRPDGHVCWWQCGAVDCTAASGVVP